MAIDGARPAERVFVTVGGQEWELVPTDKLTMPELHEAKRVSKGMALVDMETGLGKADVDAWFAWLYVSIRRKAPALTEAELTRMIGDTPIAAIIQSVRDETPEVAAADDPLSMTSTTVEPDSPNGNGSGETTPEPSTLETFGQPT